MDAKIALQHVRSLWTETEYLERFSKLAKVEAFQLDCFKVSEMYLQRKKCDQLVDI